MNRYRRSECMGFTLVEVLIFGAISCVALLCMAQLLTKAFQMQHFLSSTEASPEAGHAMDRFVSDLKEAIPGSTQWDVLTSTMPLSFAKTRINTDTGKSETYLVTYG